MWYLTLGMFLFLFLLSFLFSPAAMTVAVAFCIASGLISWEICDTVPRTYDRFTLSLTKVAPAAFSLNLFYILLFPPMKY